MPSAILERLKALGENPQNELNQFKKLPAPLDDTYLQKVAISGIVSAVLAVCTFKYSKPLSMLLGAIVPLSAYIWWENGKIKKVYLEQRKKITDYFNPCIKILHDEYQKKYEHISNKLNGKFAKDRENAGLQIDEASQNYDNQFVTEDQGFKLVGNDNTYSILKFYAATLPNLKHNPNDIDEFAIKQFQKLQTAAHYFYSGYEKNQLTNYTAFTLIDCKICILPFTPIN
jgi:hypothetical protein